MASIYEKQNEPEMQMLLCAQRKEYSSAKREQFWFVFVSVIVVSSLTFWIVFTDNPKVVSILTVINAAIIFLREQIKSRFDQKQEKAASIQQYFDSCCYNEVLGKKLIDGMSMLSDSEIAETLAKVKDENLNDFMDWYPDYRSLSAEKQILYSQKTNLVWDKRLRNFYKNVLIAMLIILLICLVAYGIYSSATFEKWCALLSCFLVIVECTWNSIIRNTKDLKRMAKIFNLYKNTEVDVCANKRGVANKLSSLQNEIYCHRKESFLIPDFIYKWRKNVYQKIANDTAEILARIG